MRSYMPEDKSTAITDIDGSFPRAQDSVPLQSIREVATTVSQSCISCITTL